MGGTTTPCRKAGNEDTLELGGELYRVSKRCAVCGEPTFLELDAMGYTYESVRPCACQRAAEALRRSKALRAKGITDGMSLGMRFEADKGYNPAVAAKARRYVEHWEQMRQGNVGLLFTGGVGTGKTFYAACIANALIDQGVSAIMTTLTRIINTPFAEYPEALKHIRKAELVVFDDVGAERDTGFAWERAFDAVDLRIRAGKPIIVTTNLSPKELAEASSLRETRIYDRILGACVAVPVTGPSIRAREKRDKAALARELLEGEGGRP